VLLAHAGNWELLAAVPPMVGVPVNVLYRPLDFKPLDLFFQIRPGPIRDPIGVHPYAVPAKC
jgi:hypothetical protein